MKTREATEMFAPFYSYFQYCLMSSYFLISRLRMLQSGCFELSYLKEKGGINGTGNVEAASGLKVYLLP